MAVSKQFFPIIDYNYDESRKFLKKKKLDDGIDPERIINTHKKLMENRTREKKSTSRLEDSFVNAGQVGSLFKLDGKAIKVDDFGRKKLARDTEFNLLKRFKNIKESQPKSTGKNRKEINEINAGKWMNAPDDLKLTSDGMIISEYELANCDFKKLIKIQRKAAEKCITKSQKQDWSFCQELILKNAYTQLIKQLAAIHKEKQTHGDLHGGNILVSIRKTDKGFSKIAFKLHDRAPWSGINWVMDKSVHSDFLSRHPGFEEALEKISKYEHYNLNKYEQLEEVVRENLSLLQAWDMDMLWTDLNIYLDKVIDSNSENWVLRIVQLWYDQICNGLQFLSNCDNAIQALNSSWCSKFRNDLNTMNHEWDWADDELK